MKTQQTFGYELTNEKVNSTIWHTITGIVREIYKVGSSSYDMTPFQLFQWKGKWFFKTEFIILTTKLPDIKFLMQNGTNVKIIQNGEILKEHNLEEIK